ncbi:DUF4190 domain-containing protein [Nocardioides sp. YIM 152588]|uniref:DUF4190 domain-containing protein n=1 Tax=Nocardioides sp. YIM 152588 TaxID=3158259 RepID=UPI0032E503DE
MTQPGPPPPYPGYPPPQWGYRPTPPTHPKATTAMVLGIVSIVSVVIGLSILITFPGGLCGAFAIWYAVRARREIRREPGRWSGDGEAMAGLVTGIVGLALFLLVVLAVAAFVALLLFGYGEGPGTDELMNAMAR